jgi:ATP-dependent DNA ligase
LYNAFPSADAIGPESCSLRSPEWVYELKFDGFRALAMVEYGRCTLFSRNGHPFASFSELASRIGYALMPRSVVMDGEIVCLDHKGGDASLMIRYSGVAKHASLRLIFCKRVERICAASG